jgi:hypothetical protein
MVARQSLGYSIVRVEPLTITIFQDLGFVLALRCLFLHGSEAT